MVYGTPEGYCAQTLSPPANGYPRMNESKNGGCAEYDDPDFASEWFDDEAYAPVHSRNAEAEPCEPQRALPPQPPPAPAGTPPSRARAAQGSFFHLAVAGSLAIGLAAGAGYYVALSLAESPWGQRFRAAVAVWRTQPPAAGSAEKESSVAKLPDGPAGAQHQVQQSPSVKPVNSAPPPSRAVASPSRQNNRTTEGVATKPARPVRSISPRLAGVAGRESPTPAPAPNSSVSSGAKRMTVAFAPNSVSLTAEHVEAMWGFSNALEGQSGSCLVRGQMGFGRFGPSLAQQRAQAVAGVLRRQFQRLGRPVQLQVVTRPVQGVAARQVEIIFSPATR